MIRLVLILCGGLYFALLVLGEDHGQKRYGLMLADEQARQAADVRMTVEPAKPVVFIPARTVMEPAKPAAKPVVAAPVVETPVVEIVAETATPLPDPQIAGGVLHTVSATQANVREGPGKIFGVLGTLTLGEEVLVVLDDNPVKGWSRVRLEGDGIEGYVATSLLASVP